MAKIHQLNFSWDSTHRFHCLVKEFPPLFFPQFKHWRQQYCKNRNKESTEYNIHYFCIHIKTILV